MSKRKADANPQTELNLDKKARQESQPLIGKVYWNGTQSHVTITEDKQIIVVENIKMEAQHTADGSLKLFQLEMCDRDEKHGESKLNIQNEIKHREEDAKHHILKRMELTKRIDEEVDIDENELEQLLLEKNEIDRIIRNHKLKTKMLQDAATTRVHFQIRMSGQCCVLTPGKLLEISFLPKPLCWVPTSFSLKATGETSAPRTEDRVEVLPMTRPLGKADCEWFEHHWNDSKISKEMKEAKLAEYRQAFIVDDAYGQYLLGRCFQSGFGSAERDVSKAMGMFESAAAQGLAFAQKELADSIWIESNSAAVRKARNRATELYTKAASQGHPGAQFKMGYLAGNRSKVSWFKKAANQGNLEACYQLGFCYEGSNGVSRDIALAREWHTRAATGGHKKAVRRLDILNGL